LEIKKARQYVESNSLVTVELLESILQGKSTAIVNTATVYSASLMGLGSSGGGMALSSPRGTADGSRSFNSASTTATKFNQEVKKLKQTNEKLEKDFYELKARLQDTDFELQRLTEQLKSSKHNVSQVSDQLYLMQSERDFFQMKWAELAPLEASLLQQASTTSSLPPSSPTSSRLLSSSLAGNSNGTISRPVTPTPSHAEKEGTDKPSSPSPSPSPSMTVWDEKQMFGKCVLSYLKDIDELKRQLSVAKAQSQSVTTGQKEGNFRTVEGLVNPTDPLIFPTEMDADFTSAISSLIAQTKCQLLEESRKMSEASNAEESDSQSMDMDERAAKLKQCHEEEEDKAFNKRQKWLHSEVEELGQSIVLKEQLMVQLLKSQQQYGVMKSFYEQKLSLLSQEMLSKEEEREKLLLELTEIAEKNSTTVLNQDRERKLREELQGKEEEIMRMKKKQDELRNLSQVQTQYSRQMSKLESDIQSMKKQRIDLSRTLQQEKKNYVIRLGEKAKEIEKLKKELQKAFSEVRKLGRSKELAETKAKDALREGAALKRKQQDLMMRGCSSGASGNASPEISTITAARNALRAVSKSFPRRYLSEEELKVKKWIDLRIAEISDREAAADALKRQYEQQLELLQRKEALEKEKLSTMNKVSSTPQPQPQPQPSSTHRQPQQQTQYAVPWKMSSSPEKTALVAGNNGSGNSGEDGVSLLSPDEEKMLELLEDRLSSINGQLSARTQRISDITRQITEAGDISGSDKAVEVLKKTAAGSLQGAHELIRMLFDMLILASKNIKTQDDQLEELLEKEHTWTHKAEELQNKLTTEKRAHDVEITALSKEFEEKLHGFLHHISTDDKDFSPTATLRKVPKEGREAHQRQPQRQPQEEVDEEEMEKDDLNKQQSRIRRSFSFNPTEVQLAISIEESQLFKTQLSREKIRCSQLEVRVEDLEKIKSSLMADIEDKNFQLKFLEEDRELFKKMAEELKDALHALGKDGKALVANAADRVGNHFGPGLFSEYMNLEEEEEDESLSVLGEFDSLVEEIHRTGFVSNSSNGPQRNNIFNRLNDPSNYTGHMRNIFKEDLASRRRRIQEIRAHEPQPKRHEHRSNSHRTTGAAGLMPPPPPSSVSTIASNNLSSTSRSEQHDMPSLSIDICDPETVEVISPEQVPSVFNRLTKNTSGIHKRRDVITPRTASPSTARGFENAMDANPRLPRLSSMRAQSSTLGVAGRDV
jgi:hypothetical protein